MKTYRFILEPYKGRKTRYVCPSCEKQQQFTRYLDSISNEYVDNSVGICNRKNTCGYHYTPKEYYKKLNQNTPSLQKQQQQQQRQQQRQSEKISYLPIRVVKQYQLKKTKNDFIGYYAKLFSEEIMNNLIDLYKLGTYNHSYFKDAMVFWQIDLENRVRTGKIFHYCSKTGKRKQQNWYHALHHKNNFQLKQVPFGLHLIKDNQSKKIAIVESEKTAILMTIFIPKFIWLAIGSSQNLSFAMLSEIKAREIILFPDAGKYELWKSKIPKLPKSNFYEISDLLHLKSSDQEKRADYDIADYCIKEYIDFKESE